MWKLALIGVCAAVILLARQLTGLLGAVIMSVVLVFFVKTAKATQSDDALAGVAPLVVLWIVAVGGTVLLLVKDWLGL